MFLILGTKPTEMFSILASPSAYIPLLTAILFTITLNTQAQEIDDKIMSKVYKMANSQLKQIYNSSHILTKVSDIRSTMKAADGTTPIWSDHPEVELSQVTFDVVVKYNKVIDSDRGEIGSYKEVLRCVLGKHKSFKWNRLSLYRNDCQDCGEENLVELKRGVNKRYASKA